MSIQAVNTTQAWGAGAGSAETGANGGAFSRRDLLDAIRSRFPSTSVAVGTVPDDQDEQRKLAMAGKLAGITIHPRAAARMQTDEAFRDKVVEGISQDQEANKPGTTVQEGGRTTTLLAHGTVVEADGSINSWSLSVSETSQGSKKRKVDGKDDEDTETYLERMKRELREARDQGHFSMERYQEVVAKLDALQESGADEEQRMAVVREALKSAGVSSFNVLDASV